MANLKPRLTPTEGLTPTEVRQGSPRRMNLRVLVGSLALSLIAGLIFYVTVGPTAETEQDIQQQGQQK